MSTVCIVCISEHMQITTQICDFLVSIKTIKQALLQTLSQTYRTGSLTFALARKYQVSCYYIHHGYGQCITTANVVIPTLSPQRI
jgi:hypothetical protein